MRVLFGKFPVNRYNRDMQQYFTGIIREAVNATRVFHLQDIQSLWSGYGRIMRYGVTAGDVATVIIKHVKLPENANHPRGWNSVLSHQRKIRSYHVESAWYRDWASLCDDSCRLPRCYALHEDDSEFLMVLEDLDASGYAGRARSLKPGMMTACLDWLAAFHATFLGETPQGLWPVGTYWHLQTRPDELQALDDQPLREAAAEIDHRLNSARYQGFVHGDAKLANFCFTGDRQGVAAVDFQYVGGGCGIKDVAYFIGSCLHEDDCERYQDQLLDNYFSSLRAALNKRGKGGLVNAVEQEWRQLFPLAWTDFHRFLKGWSPGHWKINDYSERLPRQVLLQLRPLQG